MRPETLLRLIGREARGARGRVTFFILCLAVGVLMHRHSWTRAEAWQRLQRLAQEQQLPVAAQAERLLAAVEELARTGA